MRIAQIAPLRGAESRRRSGRIARLDIAVRAGVPLKIAAKVDAADREYFDIRIRPLLDHPLVEFIGKIGEREKSSLAAHVLTAPARPQANATRARSDSLAQIGLLRFRPARSARLSHSLFLHDPLDLGCWHSKIATVSGCPGSGPLSGLRPAESHFACCSQEDVYDVDQPIRIRIAGFLGRHSAIVDLESRACGAARVVLRAMHVEAEL
jgi:hypothetical protein